MADSEDPKNDFRMSLGNSLEQGNRIRRDEMSLPRLFFRRFLRRRWWFDKCTCYSDRFGPMGGGQCESSALRQGPREGGLTAGGLRPELGLVKLLLSVC